LRTLRVGRCLLAESACGSAARHACARARAESDDVLQRQRRRAHQTGLLAQLSR